MNSASAPAARTSLFLRIYLTFVATVAAFVVASVVFVFLLLARYGEAHVNEVIDKVSERNDALADALEDPHALDVELRALERELGATLWVMRRRPGTKRMEFAPRPGQAARDRPPTARLERDEMRRLRRGRPVVRRHGMRSPQIGVPLFDRDDRLTGLVRIESARGHPRRFIAFGAGLFLLALAGGTWPLARSLTSRLQKLGASTRKLAEGSLDHRVVLDHAPRDEIDQLAWSFNEMADRLETLVTGQKTLLANVSHELRTPIARLKVLVEILGERVESLDERYPDDAAVVRLQKGLGEMQEDIDELETLIRDLLASGRLELSPEQVADSTCSQALEPFLSGIAGRFDAAVECPRALTARIDELLFTRLISNLLVNARRACPDGTVAVRARRTDAEIIIEVEDEGPGVPVEDRSLIFEPFARLDAARSRDRGGVGLGLYLSRQVAVAHGGTLDCEGRRDGRRGARFVVRLPTSQSHVA